ncbi:MAG: hypothetical protein Q4F78_08495 [Bacillota bacterium]|nr:hypothetical protein [Bacillota bacterium]
MSEDSKSMKPSRYLDNDSNDKWEWHNDGEKVEIVTMHDHPKPHVHKADVTMVPIGEMVDNPDPIIGEAHRNSAHYYQDGTVKPPKKNRKKDATDMSSKEHKAFCKRLNPSNYGNSTENYKPIQKKSSNNEDENKGQLERTLPEPTNTNSVQKMKSDMKADLNRTQKSNRQNIVVNGKSIESKVTKGKNVDSEGGKTTNGRVGKSSNTSSGKDGIGTEGKGGIEGSVGGHGSDPGSGHGGGSTGSHGNGPGSGYGGGSTGGHGSGPGSGSGGGHGGGHGGR